MMSSDEFIFEELISDPTGYGHDSWDIVYRFVKYPSHIQSASLKICVFWRSKMK